MMNLRRGRAASSRARLARLFLPDADGRRPCHGDDRALRRATRTGATCVLFYEYFHGDTGRGLGASHQTGWTALAVRCIEDVVKTRNPATVNAA